MAGGAAPGKIPMSEANSFQAVPDPQGSAPPTNGRHTVDQVELEQLAGLSAKDLEHLVRYLQICAESGQLDPDVWNRAVRFCRRHPAI